MAHLTTLMPDGSPHSVRVWVGMRGDRIAIQTDRGSQKAHDLRRDPRAAISLTPPDDPIVSIYLRGQVTEWLEGDEAWPVVDELAAKYIGAPYPRDRMWRGRSPGAVHGSRFATRRARARMPIV